MTFLLHGLHLSGLKPDKNMTDNFHEKIITEAMSKVKFSSKLFRVFVMTGNDKNEKKKKD